MTANCTRRWTQIYSIYGIDNWHTLSLLLIHSMLFTFLTLILLLHFSTTTTTIITTLATAVTAFTLLYSAGNFLYSAVILRWQISQRMLSTVPDWSSVRTALDIGCDRGILLNSVALRLKKQGSSGRVVGLGQARPDTLRALKTAGVEGVQDYVTCREGDVRRLPFGNEYFDVVVSGAAIRRVRVKEERERVVGEIVRVLKGGGVGVVWDLQHVPEYVRKLEELGMEDIRVSERVTAYMVSSQIVSFRKPKCVKRHEDVVVPVYDDYTREVRLDWRMEMP